MQTKTSILHVDDQPADLERFRSVVAMFPELDYVQGFPDVVSCYDFIRTTDQHFLIFLDVELPGHNGFWLAKQLTDTHNGIVFLTSHATYANAAFEACALDFIVKPITNAAMAETLEKIRQKKAKMSHILLEQMHELYEQVAMKKTLTRIFIQMVGSVEVVLLSNVLYIESNGNYSTFVLADQTQIVSSKSIKTYEDLLQANADFLRIHKCYIINKQYVKSISKKQRSYKVVMVNKDELEMSYQRKEELLELIMK